MAAVLRSRGFKTAGDLLGHLPRRYLDLRRADDWRLVRHGPPGTLVAIEARVADARWAGPPSARRLQLALQEPRGTTVLRAVFFHAHKGLGQRCAVGATVRVVGTLRRGPVGPELVQPRVLSPTTRTRPIEPAYGAIGALAPGTVARLVAGALERASEWASPVPPGDARALGLLAPSEALRRIHLPDDKLGATELQALADGRSEAHQALGFEELLALAVALERTRRAAGGARPFRDDGESARRVSSRLGFPLTHGQARAIAVLLTDLSQPRASRRLLVGDVGSGKTAVALAASLAVLRGGGSVAWLCPTTLVAEQHARTLERGLAGDGGPVAVLLGSTGARARKQAERVIAQGLVRVVVGTHALLEAGATPPGLGLAVIDEQHRFGVAQRLAMVAGRSPSPHLLVLSATPIPRTLALALYGDLDVLTLDEKPAGRQLVTTRVADPEDRGYVVRTIQRALAAGEGAGRVFVVAPRIKPDLDGTTSVEDTAVWLAEAVGEERLAIVHGALPAEAQRQGVEDFRRGRRPVLLGTTVVEVGLDVPEANLMVVLGAEHFGVAQLHQLRGRVGRGGQKAGCVLVPEAPSEDALARLQEVAQCHDGFLLAERDLARRGAGEWFGSRQTGVDTTLRFADPTRDSARLGQARDLARRLLDEDPTLARRGELARAVRRILARGAAPVGEEAG
ncbi:MAG: DEAD/DEAH box helicase [Deltaproteobacteria bacterium]|nr:DEAD/DEAH box helicase [Deltaproteobacteria bacterium]